MTRTAEPTRQLAPRRGLSREEAALYVGISASKFDMLVVDGRMPRPRQIDRRGDHVLEQLADVVGLGHARDC